jgi:cell division septation protein DedD
MGKDGKDGRDGKVGQDSPRTSRTRRNLPAGVRALLALLGLPALPVFPVLPALSQTDPRLIEIIRDAQEGQGDSARIKVRRLLAATAPGDTLYPQIIYTQAMVANDAADMRRQLQRVAVEYSSSSWADDALLRLVQLDYASGNLDGAVRNLERIRLDYPGSALLPQAAYWAARTYFDRKNPDLACRWIADGMTASQGNVELQNQLGYLNQRCSSIALAGPRPDSVPRVDSTKPVVTTSDTATTAPSRPDTSRRPRAPSPTPPPGGADSTWAELKPAPSTPKPTAAAPPKPPAASGRFRIQITAVRTATAAQSIAAKLKARGLSPVTVQEGGLYKVRVGEYASKADAVAALPAIKAKLGGSPFVVAES